MLDFIGMSCFVFPMLAVFSVAVFSSVGNGEEAKKQKEAAGWDCHSKDAPRIQDCPLYITIRDDRGVTDVKYLVKIGSKFCAYDEPKAGAAQTVCGKN